MPQSKSQSTSKRGSRGGGSRGSSRSSVLRRPPEKGWPLFRYRLKNTWVDALELWHLWLVLFLVISSWSLLPRYLLVTPTVDEGDVATRTVVADRDLSVVDDQATEELQRAARGSVPPIYDLNLGIGLERQQALASLFEAGRASQIEPPPESPLDASLEAPAASPPDSPAESPEPAPEDVDLAPDLPQRLNEASGLKISTEAVEVLRQRDFSPELEDRLKGVFFRVLRTGVVSDKALLLEHRETGITIQELPSGRHSRELDLYAYLDYPEQVQGAVDQELRGWEGLRSADRRAVAEFVMANLSPNLTLNTAEWLLQQQAQADDVGAVTHSFRQGEVIVRKGAVVTALAEQTVQQMVGERDSYELLLASVGTLMLVCAAAWVLWIIAGLDTFRDRTRIRFFNECLLLLMVHVLGVRFAYFVANAISNSLLAPPFNSVQSYIYAIPFASLALLAMLLYGRNVAFTLALLSSILAGLISGSENAWAMSVYSLMGSLTAIFVMARHDFSQRTVMVRAGLMIGLVNLVAVTALKSLSVNTTGGVSQLGFDLLCAFASGLLAAGVTSFLVPIYETLLGITTYIKLLELSNTNLPLLRRLTLEAPGTFQHSLAVSNLAKAGCEAIDRDPLLVHTAALYHDIGKIIRPQYFIENQIPGQNPHDKIQPSMSALILINHVKEGVELAHKYNLPRPIIDAIEQHHGTHLIKFFYKRAQERCDPETEEVREDEFRYPGPKPQTKEMGILMLADACEAASRTLVEPTRQKIRGLLRTIFENCLSDRQLEQTGMTLGDLRRVEEAFLKVLSNIYHRRVDYPGFDFNKDGKGKNNAPREPERKRPSQELAGDESSAQITDLKQRKAS